MICQMLPLAGKAEASCGRMRRTGVGKLTCNLLLSQLVSLEKQEAES